MNTHVIDAFFVPVPAAVFSSVGVLAKMGKPVVAAAVIGALANDRCSCVSLRNSWKSE